jgi:hippurate hydrolase
MSNEIKLNEINSMNLKSVRRDLHRIPEMGYEEHKTTDYLEKKLSGMGFTPYRMLDTGVVVFIDAGSDETTAFRADIDALPIQEENDHDFLSFEKGMMHACGHDGHMTMLLGFADYLSKHLWDIKKNILLVFQPAEEGGGGAKKLIDQGLIERYKVDKVFGIHMFPGLPQGIIGTRPGAFMAQNAEVNIIVKGKSAHGAMPHLGVDSIVIASHLVQKFQTILTRGNSPFNSSVITIGTIKGGDARNIIAGYTRLEGTIRTFSQETYDYILSSMQKIIDAEADIYGIEIDFEINHGYPAVVNDVELFNMLKNITHEAKFHEFDEPFMLSEDFSYYQEKAKGLFFYLGTYNETKGFIEPLHSSKFNFDEAVLRVGVRTYTAIAKELGVLK